MGPIRRFFSGPDADIAIVLPLIVQRIRASQLLYRTLHRPALVAWFVLYASSIALINFPSSTGHRCSFWLLLTLPQEFWFAQYRESTTSDAEQLPACNSEEPASLVHPSEATWVCEYESLPCLVCEAVPTS